MERDMKPVAKPLITGILLVVAAGIALLAVDATRAPEGPAVATAQVTPGRIGDGGAATGARPAVTTGEGGTQGAGPSEWLGDGV